MTTKRKKQKHAEPLARPKGTAEMLNAAPDSSPTTSIKPKQQLNSIRADDLKPALQPAQLIGHTAPKSQYAAAPAVNLKFKDTIPSN